MRVSWICSAGTSCSTTWVSEAPAPSSIVERRFEPPNEFPAPRWVSTTVAELSGPRAMTTPVQVALRSAAAVEMSTRWIGWSRRRPSSTRTKAPSRPWARLRVTKASASASAAKWGATSSGRSSTASARGSSASPSGSSARSDRRGSTRPSTTTIRGPSTTGIWASTPAGTSVEEAGGGPKTRRPRSVWGGVAPGLVPPRRIDDVGDVWLRQDAAPGGFGRGRRPDGHDVAPDRGRSGASSRSWLTKSA